MRTGDICVRHPCVNIKKEGGEGCERSSYQCLVVLVNASWRFAHDHEGRPHSCPRESFVPAHVPLFFLFFFLLGFVVGSVWFRAVLRSVLCFVYI